MTFQKKTLACFIIPAAVILIIAEPVRAGHAKKGPIKVFILAGQSNMEGQGVVSYDDPHNYNGGKGNLVWSMKYSKSADKMKHLKDDKGEWVVRDDVQISFNVNGKVRKGGLTIGYTGYGGSSHIGPELGFGNVMGDYLDEPVLLIKTAWGGKSLYVDFRPPSSGGQVGPYYTKMIEEVHAALAELGDQKYEIAGFVWQQGWNDMCTPPAIPEYAQNLVNLARDIRKEFNVPDLPFVVGELGNGGPVKCGPMFEFRKAQEAGTKQIKNAIFVKTTDFARPAELSPNPGHGHHWFGNAESYFLIGDALGEGMKKLLLAREDVKMKGDELASKLKSSVVFKSKDSLQDDSLKLPAKDMAWWQDAKFGMFIHWGLYAIPARGEWVMHNENIPATEYAKLADQFIPQHFNADTWARVAKVAGMKYMVLTARHHDGFALWDSPASYGSFCSAKTAAKRDFVAEYVQACRKAGLGVGLYYSPMDWRFPGYFKPKEMPDNAALMKRQGYGQVEELMTKYGKIDVLWYDGGWLAHKGTDADAAWFWEPLKLNAMVRKHQPKIVINPRSGWEGDFQCDEGGHDIAGPIINHPWEKCLNLNRSSWGYSKKLNVMSPAEILRMLVNVVGRGGNVLLNIGPDPDGVIPAAHVEILKKVGVWLKQNGKGIYGTRPGPFQPVDKRYCTTFKNNKVYVLVLDWGGGKKLELPPLHRKIVTASSLSGGKLAFVPSEEKIELALDRQAEHDELPDVIELVLDRDL